jgi:hypothetical protein
MLEMMFVVHRLNRLLLIPFRNILHCKFKADIYISSEYFIMNCKRTWIAALPLLLPCREFLLYIIDESEIYLENTFQILSF